jgi:hypothetical protein
MPKGIILERGSVSDYGNRSTKQEELPRNPQPTERLLDIDESGENAYQHAASGEHDDYPEIKLLVGPVVALSHDNALARDAAPHAGDVRGSQFGGVMGFGRPARSMGSIGRKEP